MLGLSLQHELFRNVTFLEFGAKWEKAYYLTGNCIRKHLKRQEETGSASGKYQLVAEIIKNYLLCLRYGSQFFYQTLPFVFEKWFEWAVVVIDNDEKLRTFGQDSQSQSRSNSIKQGKEIKDSFLSTTENLIKRVADTLPAYQLLAVFPQLISRICHSNDLVFKTLTQIIVHVMNEFPQQTLWQMMQVSNSSSQRRRQRYEEITTVFKKSTTTENWTLLKAFSSLSDQLIKICQHKMEQGTGNILRLNESFRPLEKMMKMATFPKIILPFQDSLYPMLPNDTAMQVSCLCWICRVC